MHAISGDNTRILMCFKEYNPESTRVLWSQLEAYFDIEKVARQPLTVSHFSYLSRSIFLFSVFLILFSLFLFRFFFSDGSLANRFLLKKCTRRFDTTTF